MVSLSLLFSCCSRTKILLTFQQVTNLIVFDWTVLKYKQGQKQKVQLISFCASFFFGVMGLMVTIVYTSIRLQLQSCACAVVYSYSMWLTLLVAICLLELNVLCKILKQSLNHLLELIKLQLSLVTVAPYICLW